MAAPTIAEPLLDRLAGYPRVRFMGSKHRLAPRLAAFFATLPPGPAVDAFSGSGVVAYTLKATGRPVLANDHLAFAAAFTQALVANQDVRLTPDEVELLCSPNRDGRDFIQRTFDGLYFPAADHAFLDATWSHLDDMDPTRRALAITALCLAAARKQPRGVFTVTTLRYDDGRRQLRTSLRDLFREAVDDVNAAVFAGAGGPCSSVCGEVLDVDPAGVAVAYLDPPYAPPRDDTCYIKRYHFLEGLATYWRGQEIMWGTRSRKLVKRHTPFASKRTVREALDRTFHHFRESALVVSYGSNAALGVDELEDLLRRHTPRVRRIEIPHTYAFGTHGAARRRAATEYVLVGSGPKGLV
jgi:DNA adenine methylase/adenine-specific DNA-methyltransferase